MKVVKNNNKGQVALIVLLISAVALTLGLSASKKAITDTKVDKNEAELKDAFNVAESSIDQYLSDNNKKTYTNNDNSATANVTTISIGSGITISSDGVVLDGQNNLFWLINHDTTGSICTSSCTIYNGTNIKIDVGSFNQGLKVDYFYKNGATYSVKRYVYNFGGSSVINNATSATSSITIPVGAVTPLLISITPIGGSTNLTLSGGVFPIQGEEITAVGQVGSGVKTQVKTVNKYDVPDFFIESVSAVNEITP